MIGRPVGQIVPKCKKKYGTFSNYISVHFDCLSQTYMHWQNFGLFFSHETYISKIDVESPRVGRFIKNVANIGAGPEKPE